jgi:penicillin-binding protein 2
MYKRTTVLFGLFVSAAFVIVLGIWQISNGDWLAEAAAEQHTYTLTVSSARGTIYDRNLDPLTGIGKAIYPASVVPSGEAAAALSRVCSASEMSSIQFLLSKGKPFTLMLPSNVSAPNIDVFPEHERYAEDCPAAHVLGYLDGSGKGAAGIEKSFDNLLSSAKGDIKISYQTDALGRILAGTGKKVENNSKSRKKGGVLTLDKSIQEVAEKSATSHLKKGAVVILEVQTGKILAMVSRPTFSQTDVASVLNKEDSPLLNRTLSAYSLGSVFKLVSAASALEYGVSPDTSYNCTGSIDVDGQAFHCFEGEKHGAENMQQAIANSCNTYFVKLMQGVPQANFYNMAKSLGFGSSYEIAPGIENSAGTLPALNSLKIPRALANFSFGQGELTVTPLQAAALVNTIANGGVYLQPYLYEGIVDENLHFTEKAQTKTGVRVMSEKTASLLKSFMKASIDSGTSRKGKPKYGTAGAKTATAQTGKYIDGKELNECWFVGFYPYENPKFVIAVFSEGGEGGGQTCGPVFQEIADGLYGYVS